MLTPTFEHAQPKYFQSQNASTVSNVPTFHFPVEKHLVEQLDDYILAAAVDDEKQKKAMSQSIVATRFIII